MNPFIDLISQRVVLLDGAMGTAVEALGLSKEAYGNLPNLGEALVLYQPQAVVGIHVDYLEAGADGVETNTFSANRLKLAEFEAEHLTEEINLQAARLARQACDKVMANGGGIRFVVGSIGPSGHLPSSFDPVLCSVSREELEEVYLEQAVALLQGGADVLLVETSQDLIELQVAVVAARKATQQVPHPKGWDVPVIAQFTLNKDGKMLLGTEPDAAVAVVEAAGASVVGLNCSQGPQGMAAHLACLAQTTELPVSCLPNAGLPRNEAGRAHYDMKPDAFAHHVVSLIRRFGLAIVGGCCGTTPQHIRALKAGVDGAELGPPPVRPPRTSRLVSGPLSATPLVQTPAPIIVGERLNAHGSKKARSLVEAQDWEGLGALARGQLADGASILDVNVALDSNIEDEARRMEALVKTLAVAAPAPLMLDSTNPSVLEAGLRSFPGRAIINSVNLEDGGRTLDQVATLARHYGAALVALTIDEGGMALNAKRKQDVAQKLVDRLVGRHGMDPRDIILDPLTFTLATGEERYRGSAAATLEGVARLKDYFPSCPTILGVSNVSYGLPPHARKILNGAFLSRAVKAGLGLAIIHPGILLAAVQVDPELRALADALIEGQVGSLERFVDACASFSEGSSTKRKAGRGTGSHRKMVATPFEVLASHVLERRLSGLEESVASALQEKDPKGLIDEVLLPAMEEVGRHFEAGELILPFVLKSAEVMNRATQLLERYMVKPKEHCGTMVLATVKGDIHDIGKNLVGTIMANNGFRVVDLGKNVPVGKIVEAAIKEKADLIGLSALLVSTSQQMLLCIDQLRQRKLEIPVLLGGAVINEDFVHQAAWGTSEQKGARSPYFGAVFYCKDAFSGLKLAKELVGPAGEEHVRNYRHQMTSIADGEVGAIPKSKGSVQRALHLHQQDGAKLMSGDLAAGKNTSGNPLVTVLEPDVLTLAEGYLNVEVLFKQRWGLSRIRTSERRRGMRESLEERLLELIHDSHERGWLVPRLGMVRVEVLVEDGELILANPGNGGEPGELIGGLPVGNGSLGSGGKRRSTLPRLIESSVGQSGLSHSRMGACLWAATVGGGASSLVNELFEEGKADHALLVHGFAAEMTEALARWAESLSRKQLDLPQEGIGRRLSPGYPLWPDLSAQKILLNLLDPQGSKLGISLTDGMQLIPEHSTTGMFLPLPHTQSSD